MKFKWPDDELDKCANCGKAGPGLKVCSACKAVAYCNVTCQKADFRTHKADCKSIAEAKRRIKKINHTVRSIGDPEDEYRFLYTIGVAKTHPSKVEFLTVHVHKDDVNKVCACHNFLAERLLDGHEVRPYQNVQSNDLKYAIIPLENDLRREMLDNYATACDDDVNLLLVMPYSKLPFTLSTLPPGEERTYDGDTGREVVVGGKALKVDQIRNKLADRLRNIPFIRHVNGDTLDNHVCNLAAVTPYDAFTHPEWKVDWVIDLDEEEIAFVRENMPLFAEIFRGR